MMPSFFLPRCRAGFRLSVVPPRTAIAFLLAFLFLIGTEDAGAQFSRPRPELLAAVAVPSHRVVRPGDRFTVKVRFRIRSGAWFYGPKPGGKIVPAQPAVFAFPKGVPFTFGAPKWPATEVHVTDLGAEKDRHNVYTEWKTVEIPVTAAAKASRKPYPITVTLSGQVCTPTTCIPVKAPASFLVTVGAKSVRGGETWPPFPMGGSEKPGGPVGLIKESTTVPSSRSEGYDAAALPNSSFDVSRVKVDAPKGSWVLMLLAAFAGGLILNVMPCVLPVAPVKVYTLLDHARHDRQRAMRLALAFCAGMIAVFLALGALMTAARGMWGAQFQQPVFVVTLGAVMFAMALWLLGAFEIGVPERIAGIRFTGGDMAGSFGMGALATVLATPCSGPFLGGALAWSATQPAPLILLTFATVGLGMASPYLVLVARPDWIRRLPKPGPWMEALKQGMAFVMFGVTIYFVHLLTPELHVPFLLLCLALAGAAWVHRRWGGIASGGASRLASRIAMVALIAAGAWAAYSPTIAATSKAPKRDGVIVTADGLEWLPFHTTDLNERLRRGETVIVEWTADWCPNCKFIENTVYRNPAVIERVKRGATLMRADMTLEFPEASKLLQQLGGQSIPFSAVFRGDDPSKPVILRDIYTADQLLASLPPGD